MALESFDIKFIPENETPSQKIERLARIACRAWYNIGEGEKDFWNDYGAASKQRWYDVIASLGDAIHLEYTFVKK